MNIEHIVRGNFVIKMSLKSTGNFDVESVKSVEHLHAVDGDHLNVNISVNWGRNKITVKAKEELHIEFLRLLSDVMVEDWDGKLLTTLCEDFKLPAGEQADFFFTYPMALSEEYLSLNKDDMLYYE